MTALTRRRGDTWPDEITVRDVDTALPINIAGCSFVMTLDASKTPADSSANLYQVNGVIVDAATGRVDFTPTALQSDQPPKTYYYDIQMTDALGRTLTVALDKYKFEQDITK